MKNALVVLEYALQYNYSFTSYLKRELKEHVGELETVHFIKKGDDDIVLVLEEVIAQHQNVFVVSTENFSFTGKIIATVCHDGLVLKEGMLIPLKSEIFTKDSYLIKKGSTAINVLRVDVAAKLPKILIRTRYDALSFYLFDKSVQKEIEAQIQIQFIKNDKIIFSSSKKSHKLLSSFSKEFFDQISSQFLWNFTFSPFDFLNSTLSEYHVLNEISVLQLEQFVNSFILIDCVFVRQKCPVT